MWEVERQKMNSEEGNKIGIKEIERKQRRQKTREIGRTTERRVSKKARGAKEKNQPDCGEEEERRTERRERESERDHQEYC